MLKRNRDMRGKGPEYLFSRMDQPIFRDDSILVGLDENGKAIRIPWEVLKSHVGIIGSTGAGKSVIMATMAAQVIRANKGPMIFIDPKGDFGIFRQLWAAAVMAGRADKFRLINPSGMEGGEGVWPSLGTNSYNPLIGIPKGEQLMTALLKAAEEGAKSGQPFWDKVNKKVTRTCTDACLSATRTSADGKLVSGIPFTFNDLYAVLANERAAALLLNHSSNKIANDNLTGWLEMMSDAKQRFEFSKQVESTKMFFQDFSNEDSSLGQLMNTTQPDVTLRKVYNEDLILYVHLPVMDLGAVALALGKLMLTELASLVGEIMVNFSDGPKPFPCFVDEAKDFQSAVTQDHTSKGRAADCPLIQAFQSPSQVDEKHGQHFRISMFDNLATKMFLTIEGPETSEYAASMMGKNEERESSREGDSSISASSDYRVTPTELMDLQKFEMFIRSAGVTSKGHVIALPGGGNNPLSWDWANKKELPRPFFTPKLTREGALGLFEAI